MIYKSCIVIKPDGSALRWAEAFIPISLICKSEDYIVYDLVNLYRQQYNTINAVISGVLWGIQWVQRIDESSFKAILIYIVRVAASSGTIWISIILLICCPRFYWKMEILHHIVYPNAGSSLICDYTSPVHSRPILEWAQFCGFSIDSLG